MVKRIFGVRGSELLARLRSILIRISVMRIVVKSDHGVILNLPVTILAVGAVFAPVLAVISVLLILIKRYKVDVHESHQGQ